MLTDPVCPCGASTATTTAPTTADGDILDLPMSLEDVKRHLDTANQLRRRLHDLEKMLDHKEEEVARASNKLHQLRSTQKAESEIRKFYELQKKEEQQQHHSALQRLETSFRH